MYQEKPTTCSSRKHTAWLTTNTVLSTVSLLGCLALVVRMESVQYNNVAQFEALRSDLNSILETKLNKGTQLMHRILKFLYQIECISVLFQNLKNVVTQRSYRPNYMHIALL